MVNFNLTITDEGAAFLADVIANQGNIDFTEMRFSATNYVGQESTVTEDTWTGTFITATPSASIVDTTTINVAASFDNSTFTTPKTLYSIGIVATDGNNTALVAVATSSTPQNIPEFVSTASHYAYNLNLAVSSTANITVSASTAGALYVFDIVDNLTSSATNKPLSANQGKALNDAKQNKELTTPVTIGGTSQTTVEGAIGALNTAKVDKTDITSILATGAINTTGATIKSGTYFYLDGVLCKAKADIAVNANFTLNTNYTTASIGDDLSKKSVSYTVSEGTYRTNFNTFQSMIDFTKITERTLLELITTVSSTLFHDYYYMSRLVDGSVTFVNFTYTTAVRVDCITINSSTSSRIIDLGGTSTDYSTQNATVGAKFVLHY